MALPDVMRANEILLTSGGTTYRYPLTGPIRPNLITPFPGKVIIGDQRFDDELLLSSWEMNDFRGGWLVEDMDESKQPDRCWQSTLATEFERQVFLLRESATPGNTVSSLGATAYFTAAQQFLAGDYYAAFAASAAEIRMYNAGAGWGSVLKTTPAGSVVSDAITFRQGAVNWLVFARPDTGGGQGYTRFDGSTWTDAAAAAAIPGAHRLALHDQALWATNNLGTLFKCTDLSTDTWDNTWPVTPVCATRSPSLYPVIIQLLTYPNVSGDPALHAVTQDGVYVLDEDVRVWRETQLRWPRWTWGLYDHPACTWRGDMYVALGHDVYKYNGSVVTNVGLSRDDGIPPTLAGPIRHLTPTHNFLLITNDYATWLYDGVGIHLLSKATTSATPSTTTPRWVGTSVGVENTNATDLEVWHSHADADTDGLNVTLLKLPASLFNPRKVSGTRFMTTGALITGVYDANTATIPKLAVAVEWLGDNLAAGKTLTVEYQIDSGISDSGSWTSLVSATTSNDGRQTFGSGAGITFKRIRFRLSLSTNSATVTPVAKRFVLKHMRRPRRLYAYRCRVDTSLEYDNKQPAELRDNLLALVETDTLLTVQFYQDGQELVNSPCLVTFFDGAAQTGSDVRSQWDLVVTEAS